MGIFWWAGNSDSRAGAPCSLSGEDDGFVVVGEDFALDVPTHGAGKDDFFEVAALTDEVLDSLLVGDADDVLLDDGAFVQFRRDVMAGGTDDFDTAVMGGVVGPGSGKGGEEAVVDVDDPVWPGSADVIGEDLHVAGEDDGFDLMFFQKGQLPGFGLRFVFLGDRDDVKGNAEALGSGAQGVVVGDDEGDVCLQLPGLMPAEEIVEAMRVFAYKKGEPVPGVGEMEGPRHVPGLREGPDKNGKVCPGDDEFFQVPFSPHEEDALLTVNVLVKLDDVAAIFCDKRGHGAHESGLIRTMNKKNGAGHGNRFKTVFERKPVSSGSWGTTLSCRLWVQERLFQRLHRTRLKKEDAPFFRLLRLGNFKKKRLIKFVKIL